MSKEYRKRLFALMDEIDELAKMGISLEREEISGEVEVPQRSEKVQPKIEVKKNKIEEIPEEPTIWKCMSQEKRKSCRGT